VNRRDWYFLGLNLIRRDIGDNREPQWGFILWRTAPRQLYGGYTLDWWTGHRLWTLRRNRW